MVQELIMAVLTPTWSLRGTMPAASNTGATRITRVVSLIAAAVALPW